MDGPNHNGSEYLNPCINFHRPCHFPAIETDRKGKQKKRYRQKDMMTPYEKFKSLPNAEMYLRPGVTFKRLATSCSLQSLDRLQRPHENNHHAANFQTHLWIGKYWIPARQAAVQGSTGRLWP